MTFLRSDLFQQWTPLPILVQNLGLLKDAEGNYLEFMGFSLPFKQNQK